MAAKKETHSKNAAKTAAKMQPKLLQK